MPTWRMLASLVRDLFRSVARIAGITVGDRRAGLNENELVRGLDQVPWVHYAQPDWNAVGEVPTAIRALADGNDLDRQAAYNRVLYAFGNNHAGTYFPVLVPAIPFLGVILEGTSLVARLRTLDVLTDILASFHPDPDHEEVDSAKGRRSLKVMVHEAVAQLTPRLTSLRENPGDEEEGQLAAGLLDLLAE